MENMLRKVVGLIFVSAMILSGVALVVVMLNFNKINPSAPTEAKKVVKEAEKAEEETPAQEAPAVVEEQETKPVEEPTKEVEE